MRKGESQDSVRFGVSFFFLLSFFVKLSPKGEKIWETVLLLVGVEFDQGKLKGNRARFARLVSFLILPYPSSFRLRGDFNQTGSGR